MNIRINRLFLTILMPTVLSIGLFIVLIFRFIIPYFEQNMLNQKKEMIRELINSAISIAATSQEQVKNGLMNEAEAKAQAILQISHIRYGKENKDYCWITDKHPNMIDHPYRPELNGTDLSHFTDPEGKKMFVEMLRVVQKYGEGYVDYMWQWMDDPNRIVPKISFVKTFSTWDWIIGTGIYIEDIREEITAIQKKLLGVLLLIASAMALLLAFMIRQHFRTEAQRSHAEKELLESRERYKALVEASSEGTWMILGGTTLYTNKKIEELFPDIRQIDVGADFSGIIAPDCNEDIQRIRDFIQSPHNALRIETRVVTSNRATIEVVLSLSKITLSEKKGYIVIIKELGTLQETNNTGDLAEMLGIGYFRASPGKNSHFIKINQTAVLILGYEKEEDLLFHKISDLVADTREWLRMLRILNQSGVIIRFPLPIKVKGNNRLLWVSPRLVRDDQGTTLGSDVLIEDITEENLRTEAQQDLMRTMGTLMLSLHQPLAPLIQDVLTCPVSARISQAAELLQAHRKDHLVAIDSAQKPCGMVTHEDLVYRGLATKLEPDSNLAQVMSAPPLSIEPEKTLYDALNLMEKREIGQLIALDTDGKTRGSLSLRNALLWTLKPLLFDSRVNSPSIESLKKRVHQLPYMLAPLIQSGCHSDRLHGIGTRLADDALTQIVQWVEKEMGPPPLPYAIITLGSQGRKESSLSSDQDNALIYQDPPESQLIDCQTYFQGVAKRFNSLLAEVGYPLCPGNLMACNPKWNQPLKSWKQTFERWISHPEPQALIETATFFDLRSVYGEASLTTELQQHIKASLKRHPGFNHMVARDCLQYKIPLGLFGKIQSDTDEPDGNRLNLKNPLRVLVNISRLYAISNEISQTNTVERLKEMRRLGLVSASLGRGLTFAENHLCTMLFQNELRSLSKKMPANSVIDLTHLSEIERTTLKAIFSEIGTLQNKIKHDFSISD